MLERPMAIVEFRCRCEGPTLPLPHVWEHTVGSDHALMALRAEYQAQLLRCHEELGFRHVRFHGLLCDDVGTLTCQLDHYVYSFFNADQIWDFILSIGMRPFVELSFMPEALASGRATVFRYKGNVTPPRDFRLWAKLIRKLVRHWVDRYGVGEVRSWFFEVWNEPNLPAFWRGTRAQYFSLYERTAAEIKQVDAQLQVGGPASAKNEWIEEFLEFCERRTLPADFVSTHHYPTDAFGTVDADTEAQLANSRRSVLREQAQDARRRAGGRPLFYTEWNTSSNPRDSLHDEPYSAAFIIKTAMEANGLVDAYSFWTFSDLFEENYFPSVPFHGGFGLLTIHGLAKPAYRAFQLLHRLGTELIVPMDGMHLTVDAWVVRGKGGLTVLLTNHALPRHAIGSARVRVRLSDAPRPTAAHVERIDDQHANAKRCWMEMGKPAHLGPSELSALHQASLLAPQALPFRYHERTLDLELELPPHGVAAVTVQLEAAPDAMSPQ